MDMEKTTVLWASAMLGYQTGEVRKAAVWLCRLVDGMSERERLRYVLGDGDSVEGVVVLMSDRLRELACV